MDSILLRPARTIQRPWERVYCASAIAPDILTVRFELEDITGTRFTLDIASHASGVSVKGIFVPDGSGFAPLWRQHTDQNYWFTYIDSSRTLYFAYNVWAERSDLPFAIQHATVGCIRFQTGGAVYHRPAQ